MAPKTRTPAKHHSAQRRVSGPRGNTNPVVRRDLPDRYIAVLPGLPVETTKEISVLALKLAKLRSPKMSGNAARKFQPIYGKGWVGIQWFDSYIWYQENGTRPFTMFSLAGKTIPMWINDPTGFERKKNPKARTRTTESGKIQVLIFRKAAKFGARKTTRRRVGGQWTTVDVPASYPGAPGRIALRGPSGQILSPESNRHIGVRWRNPGLGQRLFLKHSIIDAIQVVGAIQHLKSIEAATKSPTIGR